MAITDTRIEHIAPNHTCVHVGKLVIWFSYETPIAFRYPELGLVVRRNDWGPTTGKHLNYVHPAGTGTKQEGRIKAGEFEAFLEDAVNGLTLAEMSAKREGKTGMNETTTNGLTLGWHMAYSSERPLDVYVFTESFTGDNLQPWQVSHLDNAAHTVCLGQATTSSLKSMHAVSYLASNPFTPELVAELRARYRVVA